MSVIKLLQSSSSAKAALMFHAMCIKFTRGIRAYSHLLVGMEMVVTWSVISWAPLSHKEKCQRESTCRSSKLSPVALKISAGDKDDPRGGGAYLSSARLGSLFDPCRALYHYTSRFHHMTSKPQIKRYLQPSVRTNHHLR